MKRRAGRLNLNLDELGLLAVRALSDKPSRLVTGPWRLTRHSSVFRRRDGTLTLVLVWHAACGATLTQTIRGVRP